jgi:hypothetical protein
MIYRDGTAIPALPPKPRCEGRPLKTIPCPLYGSLRIDLIFCILIQYVKQSQFGLILLGDTDGHIYVVLIGTHKRDQDGGYALM